MKAKIIKDCVFPKGIKQDDFDLWYKTNDNISWIENAMEAYSEHQNKELINKAEKLILKHFGFTEDGGIIAEEQLKIFKILDELKTKSE